MSKTKAYLWRVALAALLVGAVFAAPKPASASNLLNGLSIRGGFFTPSSSGIRDITDFASWGGGLEYQLPWFPHLFNGDNWSSSISIDYHYSDRKAGIFRDMPVSINQVYTFNDDSGRSPYLGYCLTADTFGGTNNNYLGVHQPTVTRLGAGLIFGVNVTRKFYVETRYEWIDQHNTVGDTAPSGFRTYVGYRF